MTILLHRRRTGDPSILSFDVPTIVQAALKGIYERSAKHHGDNLTVTLGTPRRARTTGKGSQNSFIWGMCSDIAEQLSTPEYEFSPKKVYDAMKRMAVAEGYPTAYNPIDHVEEPESQSLVSIEQDNIFIRVIQRFADENNLYITEIVDGKPVRLTGGKGIRGNVE